MIVKVCGMRLTENIAAVANAGADWIGLIFHPKSPRFVSGAPEIPTGVRRAGVFVNAAPEEIAATADEYALDIIQLHGGETPEEIMAVRRALRRPAKIMKAVGIAAAADFRQAEAYAGSADLLLFDTLCPTLGGSGRQFDWSLLGAYRGTLPFLLSGGISPADAPRLRRISHPLMLGTDINSRFETAPAVKDAGAVEKFIRELNATALQNKQKHNTTP